MNDQVFEWEKYLAISFWQVLYMLWSEEMSVTLCEQNSNPSNEIPNQYWIVFLLEWHFFIRGKVESMIVLK